MLKSHKNRTFENTFKSPKVQHRFLDFWTSKSPKFSGFLGHTPECVEVGPDRLGCLGHTPGCVEAGPGRLGRFLEHFTEP